MAGDDAMEGTPFGRYRLVELLGRGGMGEVWRAHDTVTDRVVAIKVLPANLSADGDFERRFRREAHAAARLDTPHVVPIHDYGEIDGRLFVSMRLIKGRDLAAVLADGPLDPARAVRVIDQVAKALHAAHKVGLIHRDIKPSNILLDDDDFAYLIDFGIARVADETRLTKAGNTIGTFAYIAPERLDPHKEEDARADIYSLACVLYEALTGEPPFAGSTTAHLIAAHLNAPPPRPSTTQPNVPPRVDAVIATGMAKDRDQRYATTVELADAARDAITVPIPRPEPSAPPVPTAPPTFPAPHRMPQPPPGDVDGLAPTQQRPPVMVPTPLRKPLAQRPVSPPPSRRWWRRKAIFISVAAVVVVVAIVVAVTLATSGNQPPSRTAPPVASEPRQTVLPFTGLKSPEGVAVDGQGTVYVADSENKRVLALAAGSTAQTVLPFDPVNDVYDASGVAVDSKGTVYVAASVPGHVVALVAGSTAPTTLPFTDLDKPEGVAVDSHGTVYVTDYFDHVAALSAGSTTQTMLPFIGTHGQFGHVMGGVAVDSKGTVYVADTGNERVLALPAGSTAPTVLPFTAIPYGVAVDSSDTVYVTDAQNDRVLALAAGSTTPTVLPFTGLKSPWGVAVDSKGTVYVADYKNNRVVALPAH